MRVSIDRLPTTMSETKTCMFFRSRMKKKTPNWLNTQQSKDMCESWPVWILSDDTVSGMEYMGWTYGYTCTLTCTWTCSDEAGPLAGVALPSGPRKRKQTDGELHVLNDLPFLTPPASDTTSAYSFSNRAESTATFYDAEVKNGLCSGEEVTSKHANKPVPICFLHGVGFGVFPYLGFVWKLLTAFNSRPFILLEVCVEAFVQLTPVVTISKTSLF